MSRMRTKSKLFWLCLLVPMVGVPVFVMAAVKQRVPVTIVLLVSIPVLSSPGLINLLLTRLEMRLKKSIGLISIAVMSIASGAWYLITILGLIGLIALCGLEFKGGICRFVSTWHWGHPVVAGGFALTYLLLEQWKSRFAPKFRGSREKSGDEVSRADDRLGHEYPRRAVKPS